jgi:hypothetical protein
LKILKSAIHHPWNLIAAHQKPEKIDKDFRKCDISL